MSYTTDGGTFWLRYTGNNWLGILSAIYQVKEAGLEAWPEWG